jgi:uncharacterized membrane protein YccC
MADGAIQAARGWRSMRDWLSRAVPLDSEALSIAAGLRAATACAIPVSIAEISGHRELSWIAIIAFWGCLADTGGAWRTRLSAVAGFTLMATLCCAFALLAARSIWLAVSFVVLWSFAGAFARLWGNAASTVGSLLVSECIVCLGTPAADLGEGLTRTGLTVIGGAWAMLLALAVWRLYPYGPARQSVGACWRALAGYATAMADLQRAEIFDDDASCMAGSRNAVRSALEAARDIMAAERRKRSGSSRREALLLELIADADQMFVALVALGEVLAGARASFPAHRALRLMLLRIARASSRLCRDLERGRAPPPLALATPLARLKRSVTPPPDRPEAAEMLQHTLLLFEQIIGLLSGATDAAGAVRRAHGMSDLSSALSTPETLPDRPPIRVVLRTNLTWRSLHFRHALRLAVAVGFAVWLADFLAVERGYWIGITTAVILQPYLATTWQRALERVAGSVLGGVAAGVLSLVLPGPLSVAAAVFPLAAAAMAVRGVNYTLFVFLLTPQFVLIAELFQTGMAPSLPLAGLRALDSVLGGVLGLAAGLFLWPSRESLQLPAQLAQALDAQRRYLVAALDGAANAEMARRQAGLATNNAEASLQRFLGEPGRRSAPLTEPAMTLAIGLRRLSAAAAALLLLPPQSRAEAKADLGTARNWVDIELNGIATAIRDTKPPPPINSAPVLCRHGIIEAELGRIGRQIDIIQSAANRMAGPM